MGSPLLALLTNKASLLAQGGFVRCVLFCASATLRGGKFLTENGKLTFFAPAITADHAVAT